MPLHHRGFSCWISCEGKQLSEYQQLTDKDGTKFAWIASELGKNFSVCWQDNSDRGIASSGHVFIDGKDVASAIIRPGRTTPVERSGVKKGTRVIQPFAFSELSLTDDDKVANKRDKSTVDIGTIRVEIKLVRLGRPVDFEGYEARNVGVVHEQAKKAGAHCTRFQTARRSENSRTVAISTSPYDEDNPGPYVSFVFRYRDREMLKAMGIIDNGVKREATTEVIEIGSDTEAEGEPISSSQKRSRSSYTPPLKRVKTEPTEESQLPTPPDPEPLPHSQDDPLTDLPPIASLANPQSQSTVANEDSQDKRASDNMGEGENVDQLASESESSEEDTQEDGEPLGDGESDETAHDDIGGSIPNCGPPTSSPEPEQNNDEDEGDDKN